MPQKQEELKEKEIQFRQDFADNNPNSLIGVMALTDLLNLKSLSAKDAKAKFTNLPDTLKTSRLGKNLDRLINNAVAVSMQKRIDIGTMVGRFSLLRIQKEKHFL